MTTSEHKALLKQEGQIKGDKDGSMEVRLQEVKERSGGRTAGEGLHRNCLATVWVSDLGFG